MDLLKLYHDEDSTADTSSEHLSADSPGTNDIFEEQPIAPRIGEEYQVELPLLERRSQYLVPILSSVSVGTTNDTDFAVKIGLDIPVTWTLDRDELEPYVCTSGAEIADVELVRFDGGLYSTFHDSLNGRAAEVSKTHVNGSVASTYKGELFDQKPNLGKRYCPIPALPMTPWTDDEKKIFLLGLYVHECKRMGDILSFYYGSFYRSDAHRRWSECRKMRSRKYIYGQRIFSGWRHNELLQRLDQNLSEAGRSALVEATKALGECKITLEEYVFTLKMAVSLKALVEAVGIGIENYDLTGLASDPAKATHGTSTRAEIPVGKACSSLTSVDIIKFLTGDFRLSKARSNDLFWEAVWPRLLAKGWHSEQPKNSSFGTSRHSLVFLVPVIKKFSRKLVKGKHYFDSVSDVLNEVASDPRLLELDIEGLKGDNGKDEHGWDGGSNLEENGSSDQQNHLYLRPRLPNCNSELMKFTVVDTSLVHAEPPFRVRELKSLPVDPTIIGYGASSPCEADSNSSEDQPISTEMSLTDGKKVKEARRRVNKVGKSMLADRAASVSKRRVLINREDSDGRYPNGSSEFDPTKDEEFQFGVGSKSGKPNYLSPVSKRQRLTACRNPESVFRALSSGDLVEKEIGCLVKPMEVNESVVAEAGLVAKDSPMSRTNTFKMATASALLVLERGGDNQEDLSLKLVSIPLGGQNPAKHQSWEYSNGVSNEPHDTVNARRHSTRNRPLTTRALEALASGFLATRRKGKATKTKVSSSVASRSSRPSYKTVETSASATTVDRGSAICDLTDAKFEAMEEECSSNPNLP
ncbi:unnamed protein product [Spirodela intermedia]|uniref:Uncharacterized protein n=1 Tax=Spirodela intermedia TaxID=51605 RepID=A0A7I8IZR9_SPIIN|nr:unnamed protein product [Spirodela intermedia]CAA6663454.1 unnamed protein product [Spirodela intermedia]